MIYVLFKSIPITNSTSELIFKYATRNEELATLVRDSLVFPNAPIITCEIDTENEFEELLGINKMIEELKSSLVTNTKPETIIDFLENPITGAICYNDKLDFPIHFKFLIGNSKFSEEEQLENWFYKFRSDNDEDILQFLQTVDNTVHIYYRLNLSKDEYCNVVKTSVNDIIKNKNLRVECLEVV